MGNKHFYCNFKKNNFRFGGSPNEPRFCNKADFDYIIDTNQIKLVGPQS